MSTAATRLSGLNAYQRLGMVMLVTWLVLPMVPLFIWSFAKGWYFPQILPKDWSLDAWRYVFSEHSQVLGSLGNTVLISLGVTFLSLLVGIPAGRALGMHRFKGKALVEVLVLAPTIVPGIAVALGIHVVFIKYGLANSVFGVMLVHLVPTLPYMILVMAGVFANYDARFEAQARTLGATPLRAVRHVMFPIVMPGIVVGALFAFIVSWSQYILTLLIGGGRVVTLPLLLFNFATSGRNDIAGAICVLYIIPGIIVLTFTARHLTGANTSMAGLGRA